MTDDPLPTDPRVTQLREQLATQGYEAGSGLDSRLRSVFQTDQEAPGTWDAALELCLGLARDGIDPERVLDYAIPSVVRCRGQLPGSIPAWLKPLDGYVRSLHEADVEVWSAVSDGVRGLCRLAWPSLDEFRAGLERFGALLVGLKAQNVETQRLVIYGMGSLSEVIAQQPWALEPACTLAERVGAIGGQPGWIWQGCVSEWASALVGEPAGPEVFGRALGLLGDFLEEASAAGMSAGSRISDGLATLARYGPAMQHELEEWLDLILSLIRSMTAQDMSPYLPIGNGLAGIVGGVQAIELSSFLRLAVRLTDRGIHPGGMLYEAFLPAASALGTTAAIDIGRRLGDQGFDPFHVLRDAAARVGDCAQGWDAEVRSDRIDECVELLLQTAERLHADGASGDKYFLDAVPYHAERATEHPQDLLEALHMGLGLAEKGIQPGMTLAFGWPTVLDLAEQHPWILDEGRRVTAELMAGGIDPETTLSRAFPVLLKVTEADRAGFAQLATTLVDVAKALAAAGVNPRDVLYRDISAMAEVDDEAGTKAFGLLLEQLHSLLKAMAQGGVSPLAFLEAGLPAAARASKDQPWRLQASFEAMARMAQEGRDGARLLELSVKALAEADQGERARLEAMLRAVQSAGEGIPEAAQEWCLPALCEAASRVSAGDPPRFARVLNGAIKSLDFASADRSTLEPLASALPLLAEIAGDDGEEFAALMETAATQAARLVHAERQPDDLLWYGLRAIAAACASTQNSQQEPHARVRAQAGRGSLEDLADLLLQRPVELGRALVRPSSSRQSSGSRSSSLELLAGAAAGDLSEFRRGLHLVFDAAPSLAEDSEQNRELTRQLVRVAAAIAPRSVTSLDTQLRWLGTLLQSGPMEGSSARILGALDACLPILRGYPSSWNGLIRPILVSHGPRSVALLVTLRWIGERWVQQESDLEVLADIATQFGVRVAEIYQGLLLRGLQDRTISDLTAERASLLGFLRDVPLADSQIYGAYRSIQNDASSSAGQKQEQVQELQAELHSLSAAVRAGSLTDEQAGAALLPLVLFYVFPPGTTSSRERHLQLFQRFPDHEEHLVARDPGEDRRRPYALRQGAWELRPGVELDRGPWDWLLTIAGATPKDAPMGTLTELGWDLLGRWTEGRIGRESVQSSLIADIIVHARRAGVDLPKHADSPVQLLECKEFLGDQVRDLVEQALIAARESDSGRYDRMVRDKLAPAPTVGPGLVKSLWRLAQDLASGKVSGSAAQQRIEGQLRRFAVDWDGLLTRLAACPKREAVRGLLEQLPPLEIEIEAGKEQARLLADLVGQALTAMQRELFGGPGHPARLVYELSDAAPPLELTCEVTKRRAHAPIGLCEGVCVATDQELWDSPHFFQVVFWGADGIAAGGMHLLIVSEDGEESLVLPGINPSPRLLDKVEPSAVLELALDYAWRLARRWGCSRVWVPTSPAIHSNRRAIQLEIASLEWEQRSTDLHPFSFSPYAYTFHEVFVVPEPPAR